MVNWLHSLVSPCIWQKQIVQNIRENTSYEYKNLYDKKLSCVLKGCKSRIVYDCRAEKFALRKSIFV